jgi:hypothetical protein
MGSLSDRDQLVELLGRYADIPDTKDWDVLPKTVFTDPVTFDLESLTGQPASESPRDVLMSILGTGFSPYTATHHAVTGHRVTIDGDRATIHAHVRAEHWLPRELVGEGPNCWLVVGFYDDEAVRTHDGWRLTKVKLTAVHQENAHLLNVAQAAAKMT